MCIINWARQSDSLFLISASCGWWETRNLLSWLYMYICTGWLYLLFLHTFIVHCIYYCDNVGGGGVFTTHQYKVSLSLNKERENVVCVLCLFREGQWVLTPRCHGDQTVDRDHQLSPKWHHLIHCPVTKLLVNQSQYSPWGELHNIQYMPLSVFINSTKLLL